MKFFNAFLIGSNVVLAVRFAATHDWGWLLASLTMIAWCGSNYYKSAKATDIEADAQ